MEYGNKLNPERSMRTAKGIKGTRQKVIVTHTLSSCRLWHGSRVVILKIEKSQ